MDKNRTPGGRIARLRETHKLTREALSERSGLSVQLIARMEDELFVPDLAPLVKLARALGVRLGTFMDDQEELGPVITRSGSAQASARFIAGDSPDTRQGLDFKALAAGKSGRHMEPFIVEVSSDETDTKLSTHEGEEFIYVLSGTIEVAYGSDRYALATGDSIYYDSIVPHRVRASGASIAARILAVVYAPF
ncbi:XRE family transcriptional regulator [Treponema sp.]